MVELSEFQMETLLYKLKHGPPLSPNQSLYLAEKIESLQQQLRERDKEIELLKRNFRECAKDFYWFAFNHEEAANPQWYRKRAKEFLAHGAAEKP